jgi:putative endonuclease
MKTFYVYMMTNQSRVILYTGITNSLIRRVWQHQSQEIVGFTKSYKANRLVYFEHFDDPRTAITREKEIKGWRRAKENALIERLNPKWADLSPMLFQHMKRTSHTSASRAGTTMIQRSRSLSVLRGPSLRSG